MWQAVLFAIAGVSAVYIYKGWWEERNNWDSFSGNPHDPFHGMGPDFLAMCGTIVVMGLSITIYQGVFWQLMGYVVALILTLVAIYGTVYGLISLGQALAKRHKD